VVHNLLQSDAIDSVAVCGHPAVVYTSDNPESVSHNRGISVYSSWFRAASHIVEAPTRHSWMPHAKRVALSYWVNRLNNFLPELESVIEKEMVTK